MLRHKQGVSKPRSIYQYSNMATRLSGQTFIFGVAFFVSKSLLGIVRQKNFNNYNFDPKASEPCKNINLSKVAYSSLNKPSRVWATLINPRGR